MIRTSYALLSTSSRMRDVGRLTTRAHSGEHLRLREALAEQRDNRSGVSAAPSCFGLPAITSDLRLIRYDSGAPRERLANDLGALRRKEPVAA